MWPASLKTRGTFRRSSGVAVAFSLLAVGVVVLSPTVGALGVLGSAPARGDLSGGLAAASTSSSGASDPKVLASCWAIMANSDVFDPADGLIYVASYLPGIYILEPSCHLAALLTPTWAIGPYGTAYDPLTKEVVVTDTTTGVAYVLRGTERVKTVGLGGSGIGAESGYCPLLESWDADLRAILIADPCSGGVDELTLSIMDGVTRATVVLDAFDRGNDPTAVLVADGYIFSAGNAMNVYDDRTLAFLGTFAVHTSTFLNSLAWDPLNNTVVLGKEAVPAPDSVIFIDASSIRTGTFTFHRWITHGMFSFGVAGVAYSPFTKGLYFTAYGGGDLWELGSTGALSHVYVGPGAGLTYDPVNHDMYVCGWSNDKIYVVS
jgi:hypothetical protein